MSYWRLADKAPPLIHRELSNSELGSNGIQDVALSAGQLWGKLPHRSGVITATVPGCPVQVTTGIERQITTRVQHLIGKVAEVLVMPAIAGIKRLEDVAVVVLLKAEAAAGGDLRTVISRTVYLAGGIDRKVVQDIELIIMVDEIVIEQPAGICFLQRENYSGEIGFIFCDAVEIACAVLDKIRRNAVAF
jgi:hypothetical protein